MAAESAPPHPPAPLLLIPPSAISFEMFMLDCLTIYTGNPRNAFLLSKPAVSAAGDPKPGSHPGNPGAESGRLSAAKGLGIALPKQKAAPLRSVTGQELYRQDESELWQQGSCRQSCSQHPRPPPGLCNRNPPCLHLLQSQVGIFWWSYFSAGKFQSAEIEALAKKPSWAPEEEEEEAEEAKGNCTAQWSGLGAVAESQVQSLVLSQAGQGLLPRELSQLECGSGVSHLLMTNSGLF